VKDRYEKLRELRKKLAGTLDLEPEVLVGNSVLESIARDPLKTVEEARAREGLSGWRTDILGKPVYECLKGG
jgi:ribonuclease D